MRAFYSSLLAVLLLGSCRRELPLSPVEVVDIGLARALATGYAGIVPAAAGSAAEDQRKVDESIVLHDASGIPALYVFNYEGRKGYLVLSAEWQHEPLCAFVPEGRFEPDTVPSMLVQWYNATVEHIELLRKGVIENRDRALFAWQQLAVQAGIPPDWMHKTIPEGGIAGCEQSSYSYARSTGPLLPIRWGQQCSYNEQCPVLQCTTTCSGNNRAPTGCVATAMSQLMRYWNFPSMYNWSSMPADMGNAEVQRLMRRAGQSVSMNYNCTGSGAAPSAVPAALKLFFGYGSAQYGSYTPSSAMVVRSNLDKGWPVLLGGFAKKSKILFWNSYSEAHQWVCDGYEYRENGCYAYLLFHMNWGWHETGSTGNDHNGWYAFNHWNPAGRLYQYAQDIVHEVHP